ncbi:ATP-binding protein [Hornefia butyriciproducens]|uniref:ATP-binding protein n=1 Tax=Hornefia butyriciproducens TaxID=2652293 RepID=UPI0023EFF565|nr:ATP-binding protein [Hornefia butyriciproducens]MDD6298386.1 ATP-binding protein [Hornefia butyriciproducens]MDY6212024.1 ATP-binding protein [Hornefia butyriciproducens]
MLQFNNLEELIGEATEYDKKQAVELKKPKSWCKSVSAFANTSGGILIFGIADDNSVVGLSDAEHDAEAVSEIMKNRLSPVPEFNLSFHVTENGKKLLLLHVFRGEETPYYYSADGTTEAYIRIGNESVPADSTDLKRLVLRGRNSSYDSQNSPFEAADYSFTKLRERFKVWTGKSLVEKDLSSFGMIGTNGNLTNAGALLADESPIRWSRVFCTRWNGKTKGGGIVDALNHAEYAGSLISLLNDAESFIKNNSKTIWKKLPDSRLELPEYVHRSYFEALVNALIHRDYLINGSEVHIDIFDDRMEIYSPGGMPDGTLIQDRNIKGVPSIRRNPVLADIFARLGYMERSGSGLGKIREAYEFSANYSQDKAPVFYSDRSQFLVTLPNLNYEQLQKEEIPSDKVADVADRVADIADISERQKQILSSMEIGTEYSSNDIADMIGLKGAMTRRLLNDLVDKGLLNKTAETNRRRYLKVPPAK